MPTLRQGAPGSSGRDGAGREQSDREETGRELSPREEEGEKGSVQTVQETTDLVQTCTVQKTRPGTGEPC